MNINQKFLSEHPEIFDLISIKRITLLNEIDNKIKIIKTGQYKYFKMSFLELDDIKNFINNLDHDKIFIIIPFITVNNRSDEPFTVLSQQMLVTRNSNSVLINNSLDDKIIKAFELFNSKINNSYYTIFKYKSISIDFNSYKKFN
jgi:hypothetical protein